MVAMKMPDMEHMPNTCDDCIYYGSRLHSYNEWKDICDLCAEPDWYYDGKNRPINCPLIEINN